MTNTTLLPALKAKYIILLILASLSTNKLYSLDILTHEDIQALASDSTISVVILPTVKDNINIPVDKIDNRIRLGEIYDQPYSLWKNYPDYGRLKWNTGILFGGAIGGAAILYMMPESISNWNKDEMSFKDSFGDWWKNVKAGPTVDHDNFFLNYIAHPYFGGIYYMSARSAGVNAAYSLLYSIALSTMFWEYGIESFAEIPSFQDIIVTPIGGAIVGELFYLAKREIVNRNFYLLNSRILGHAVVFLMDPLNEVMDLCSGNFKKKKSITTMSLNPQPMILPSGKGTCGLSFKVEF